MNRYLIALLTASMLLVTSSCIKEVEFSGEETAPLPVLNALVTDGDTALYVDLTKSLFFLRKGGFAPITDATVTLTLNGIDYHMDIFNDSVYTLQHGFSAGDVLSVTADVSEFGLLTTETVAVPSQPILVDAVSEIDSERDNRTFTLRFVDNPAQQNYYRIRFYHEDTASAEIKYEYIGCYDTRTLLDNSDYPSVNFGQNLFFGDSHFNGDTCKLDIETLNTLETQKVYYVVVENISESMYKYGSTLHRYDNSRGNPFTEPVQVYTNISGWMGVLAAKSVSMMKINFFERK